MTEKTLFALYKAASMIRDKAKETGNLTVASQSLATIAKELEIIVRRKGDPRKWDRQEQS